MNTLISPLELAGQLTAPDWRIFDCRFSLADPSAGADLYAAGHVPGALHADLERHLSGQIVPGTTGRHPLPEPGEWLQRVRGWGLDNTTRVVAYDDAGGAFAARLWWLLRWLGHERVALLDGGWQGWVGEQLPVSQEMAPAPTRGSFQPRPPLALTIDSERLVEAVSREEVQLLDARDAARYRGEVEPIDPVAGHIPGAISLPFSGNLDANGRFRSREELANRFLAVLDRERDDPIVCYCGSGVTAAHNVLAMVHAGLPEPYLYPGSWSEWIVDPRRPVATG